MFGVKNSRSTAWAFGPTAIDATFLATRSCVRIGLYNRLGSARIDVAPANLAGFSRPASGQPLEFDESADLAIEKGKGGVDLFVTHRRNRLGFTGFRSAGFESRNRSKGFAHRAGFD